MAQRRFLTIALIVSILCNALLAGYGLSYWLGLSSERAKGGILQVVGHRLTRHLDPESRERVSEALVALEPDYRASLTQRRQDYRQLRALLAEAQVDQDAVDVILGGMKDRSADLLLRVHNHAVDAIVELPADKRAAIAGPEDP